VLENKAGSFPLSFFLSLLFHQELQKKRRRRGRGRTHVSSSTRERERESNGVEFQEEEHPQPFFLLAKFKNQVILEFSNSQK
jgi:hypothetical protein